MRKRAKLILFENIYESLKSYIMNRKYYYGRTVNVTVSKDSFLSDNEIFNVFSDLDCIYYISDNKITKVECLNKNHEYFRFIFDF